MKRKREPLTVTSAHAVGDIVRTFRGDTLRVVRVTASFGYWLSDDDGPYQSYEICKPGQVTKYEKRRARLKLRKAVRK